MNDDNQENRMRIGSFRYVVLALAALLVLSLGFALIPADPPPPQPPPFTEQARAAAFNDAVELRAAGLQLGAAGSDGGAAAPGVAAAVEEVVSLLTLQARALLAPQASAEVSRPSTASGTTSAPATVSGTASTPPASPVMTAAELANALAASGAERLQDAKTADGGMARLLAGAGTAQFLAARELAAAAGAPDPVATNPVTADPVATDPVGAAESDPEAVPEQTPRQAATTGATDGPVSATSDAGKPTGACPATPATQGAGPGAALAAAAAAERAAVYAYQAALTRLPADLARPASEFLKSHEELAEDAERLTRLACGALPPQQPGYALTPEFLAAPAAGLAQLEARTLPGYGDVVATTEGTSRTWALATLQAVAARTVHWGGDPGPIPGLLLDEARLPDLPA